MSTNYDKGYAFENKLVNFLREDAKWPYAIRTAGSHSPCDVLGITPNGVTVMFQCKTTIKKSFDLTALMNDVSVFKLKRMPSSIRKILAIKIGFRHTAMIYMYEWIEHEQQWGVFVDFTF
jgi:Holliday junction resolvase